MSRFAKAAFLAIVFGTACLPAAAGPIEPYAVKISIAGLDLDSDMGAATAMTRINAASAQVCGARPSLRQIKAVGLHQKCRREFTARAVQAIDAPRLTALYGRSNVVTLAAR
jgi:UrcA family protein